MIVYDRPPTVHVSIHGPELRDILVSTALTEGLKQDAPRSFVHDDDVIAREGMLWVRRHERNVQFPVFLGGAAKYIDELGALD